MEIIGTMLNRSEEKRISDTFQTMDFYVEGRIGIGGEHQRKRRNSGEFEGGALPLQHQGNSGMDAGVRAFVETFAASKSEKKPETVKSLMLKIHRNELKRQKQKLM